MLLLQNMKLQSQTLYQLSSSTIPARRTGKRRHKNEENKKFLKKKKRRYLCKLEKRFGRPPAFVASILTEHARISMFNSYASVLEEALQVINCCYEKKSVFCASRHIVVVTSDLEGARGPIHAFLWHGGIEDFTAAVSSDTYRTRFSLAWREAQFLAFKAHNQENSLTKVQSLRNPILCRLPDRADKMDLQNTAFTVQLGRGASIQLANAMITTGNTGATIQFGSVDFPAVVARTAAVPMNDANSERPARRLYPAGAPTRHAYLPAQRPTTEATTRRTHLPASRTTTAAENPRKRTSVFERLSQPEAPIAKRVVTGGRISVVTANTTSLPNGLPTPRKNDAEASSSGGRLTRRQRRKKNAEMRAQQQQSSVHPSNLPAREPEANIPIRNKFTDLRWVKRNSSTGELKRSFWDQQPEVLAPPRKKEPETLSARVYRVLKTVKEKGLK
ncbi:hypothetical protein IEQ34_002181 [Dendrobium chrysotoxum]|uniref:Uncharacterized protein n=1 Tax=Dendrobium chrysotoxum TaxID=161865 RepID=A0AAV7HMI7_DENCH|nr:hypothetical protein IEQ34_002181 [Dendrobium chrysotoxum]